MSIPKPHGGKLVERVIDRKKAEELKSEEKDLFAIEIDKDLSNDVINIAYGVFSPLEGFMNEEDLNNVLKEGRLSNGLPWTIPIVLDLDHETAKKAKDSRDVLLKYANKVVAIMHVEDFYKFDKRFMMESVYQTTDINHPGVVKCSKMNEYLVSGKIDLVEVVEDELSNYRMFPKDTRKEFERRGWKSIVGFQTRNVPHLAHETLQKTALNLFDGLFINPLIGKKKGGDFKNEVVIKAYEILLKHYYPKDSFVFATLHTEMRYAGPKEAIFHAIVRKNFGCTHFIVGRDHAGVGNYYHKFAAQEIFKYYPDLDIIPIFFTSFFYCKKCKSTVSEKVCPHNIEDRLELSGTRLRSMIINKERPSELLMRPEVAEFILNYNEPFIP